MKHLLLILLASFYSTLVLSQTSIRSENETKENPLDIVDYYLIIPGNPYSSYAEKKKETAEFQFRKTYLDKAVKRKVEIDRKNAFIKISDNSSELEYRLEMTYFIKADGKKIIAVSEYKAGGDCDSRTLKFYIYSNQSFSDITSQTIPSLSLNDFCPAMKEKKYEFFYADYKLPQVGTSIEVKALPLCEQDNRSGIRFEDYYKFFQGLQCNNLKLVWNKITGTFSKK